MKPTPHSPFFWRSRIRQRPSRLRRFVRWVRSYFVL